MILGERRVVISRVRRASVAKQQVVRLW
jgi:hypothetical protein